MIWFLIFMMGSDADQLRAHVKFLASDLLEGRETSQRGQLLAAAYLQSCLEEAGIPGAFPNQENPYYQSFELTATEIDSSQISLSFKGGGPKRTVSSDFLETSIRFAGKSTESKMAFIGYGRMEEGLDDFEGVDLKDRWAVLLASEEDSPSHFWKVFQKLNSTGCKGLLVISPKPQPGEEGGGRTERSYSLTGQAGPSGNFAMVRIYDSQAEAVFGRAFADLQDWIQAKKPARELVLKRSLTYTVASKSSKVQTGNVVARVEGTDPERAKEILVVSAHYDHVGMTGQTVYNGADDNGSGTSVLLELAQRIQSNPTPRTIIFLFLTGEEVGLLGSEYYLGHMGFPTKNLIANINIDMVGRNGSYELGYLPAKNEDVTSLSDWMKEVNSGLEHPFTFNEELDKYHHRSDHYNFVKVGVPAIFFFSDVHEDYHRPTDDWQKLDYDKLARVLTLVDGLVHKIGNTEERPVFSNRSKSR